MSVANIPRHIAIIMDGNRRWAKKRGLPKILGHKQGIKTIQNIVKYSQNIGVKYLTFYAFSLENWQRPKVEVDGLMQIFREYLNNDIKSLIENNTRVIFIGQHDKLEADIRKAMKDVEEASSTNNFYLIIALSYGSTDEILSAAVKFSKLYDEEKHNNTEKIRNLFGTIINPHNIPNPDLLIRTAGEQRLSNFLLWQLAYTELFFTSKLWPDFNKNDLMDAIEDFNKRERRYGK